MKVIVSITTIPKRMERFKENIPSILNQKYPFDVLMINIPDTTTNEETIFYNSIRELDNRIIINKVDDCWRSCNKLIPTLKLFPDDIIITMDDDIYYPSDCVGTLMRQHIKTPDCIIAQETNPLIIEGDRIRNIYAVDIKLMQKSWARYLSNCCLFPPHVFDGTELFNYDKMMEVTKGSHDEFWFWINSTLNGVMVIGLNYVKHFRFNTISEWNDGEYRLCDINTDPDIIQYHEEQLNKLYGEQILKLTDERKTEFFVDKNNIYAFIHLLPYINRYYGNRYKITKVGLDNGWSEFLDDILDGYLSLEWDGI